MPKRWKSFLQPDLKMLTLLLVTERGVSELVWFFCLSVCIRMRLNTHTLKKFKSNKINIKKQVSTVNLSVSTFKIQTHIYLFIASLRSIWLMSRIYDIFCFIIITDILQYLPPNLWMLYHIWICRNFHTKYEC